MQIPAEQGACRSSSVAPGCTHYLLNETHEAPAEPPGLVAVALQRVDCHLRRVLVGDGHDVDRIIRQSSICLE